MSQPRENAPRYHGARENMLFAYGASVVMATAMIILGNATLLDLMIAMPTFAFMAYISLALVNAQRAKRGEDERGIQSTEDHVLQCERSLDLIEEAIARATVDYRTYMALNRLAITIRLFVSKYGRYLEERGVWAALEAESLVMEAELVDAKSLKSYIGPIRDCVCEVGKRVLAADDPRFDAIQKAP